MGALAPISPWIPEDDFLLKNAVEAGASLESLAKGAVEFSRRFTVQELQERWLSLLYDPIVSAEASACIIEFEHTSTLPLKANKFGALKDNKYFLGKRKVDSVRSCYYSMRKRFCDEPLNPMDIDFLIGPSNAIYHESGVEPPLPSFMLGDATPNYLELQQSNVGMMNHFFPQVMMDGAAGGNVSEGNTFALPGYDNANNMGVPGHDIGPLDSQFENQNPCQEFRSPDARDFLGELSTSLLDFTDDDNFMFLDVAGNDVKSDYDDLGSLFLNSPCDMDQDNIQSTSEAEAPLHPNSIVANTLLNNIDSKEKRSPHPVERHITCDAEIQMPSSTSALNSQFPEMCDGVILCSLNTESPEIPCNDDIHLSDPMPSSFNPFMLRNFREANNLSSSFVKDFSGNCNPSDTPGLLKRECEILGQTHASSPFIGSRLLAEKSLQPELELPKFETSLIMSSHNNIRANANINSVPKEEIPEVDNPDIFQNGRSLHAELRSNDIATLKLEHPSTSDQDEQLIESDDDIPYFSDVEALILDMDLGPEPDEQDVYLNSNVSRYRREDAKRSIVRLEQAAHSYMNRAIASHGAFAVLYGRHSKHYLSKPEVLLGRGTGDSTVDIDLGREGRANKVSRQQAIISLEKDGLFYMKNIGRRPIFMNNQEVASSQCVKLHSGCLIQIRALAFIFETNQACVKRALDDAVIEGQTQQNGV